MNALIEQTWNEAYPDRKPWAQIGDEARAEWVRVFGIYEGLKANAGRCKCGQTAVQDGLCDLCRAEIGM